MAKYKIEKVPALFYAPFRYEVYKKGWFGWEYITLYLRLSEAEEYIRSCKTSGFPRYYNV